MSRRDDRVPLRHMLQHASEAVELASTRNRDDLEEERLVELSLVRLVEIVGEAASRVTSETREAHPEIPWREIVGMRNRLIHGYDVVDHDVLWQTIREDLPPLIRQLEKVLAAE